MATPWKLKVNMAGVSQFEEIVNLPAGPYKVKPIRAVEHVSKADAAAGSTEPTSVWIDVQVVEGAEKGKTVTVMINKDLEHERYGLINKRGWQGLALSMGATAEQAMGEIEFSEAKILKGKDGLPRTLYIVVTPAPIGEDGKPDYKKSYKNFVSPETYALKMGESAPAAEPETAPEPKKAKAPAAPKAAPIDVDL